MTFERPSRTFDLTIDGETQEIKMSNALFQEIMKVIPEPEKIANMLIQDFYLREYVIRRVLTGQKKVKSDDDLVDLFEVDVDDDEIDEMVLWVTDHVLYFFMNTAEKSLKLGQKYQGKMAELTQSDPSQTGAAD